MNPKIQEVSRNYFQERSEKNFNVMYDTLRPVVEAASKRILKDDDLVSDNVTEVFMKIHNNKEFIFAEDKSFLSWIFNTTRHSAISIYNKARRVTTKETPDGKEKVKIKRLYLESDFATLGEEEIENTLDYLAQTQGVDKDGSNHEEEETPYTMQVTNVHDKVIKIINDISPSPQDAQLLVDRLIGDISPETLKDTYGIASRVTVTSRRRRALVKINDILTPEINERKLADGNLQNGDVVLKFEDGTIRHKFTLVNGKVCGKTICYFPNGKVMKKVEYNNGVRHGEYEEFFVNGFMKKEGKYENGTKSGVWSRYDDEGNIQEDVDYSNHGHYIMYSEDGAKKEKEGFLYVPQNAVPICTTYQNGVTEKVGILLAGKKIGVWRRYHENGRLSEILDTKTGKYTLYSENGKVEETGTL